MTKIIRNIAYCTAAAVVASVTLLSCGTSSATNEVVVDEFPTERTLTCAEGQDLELPSMGIMEINIADDMLVVSTSNPQDLWQLYSLPEVDSIGSLFRIGGGPGELSMPVPSILASFYHQDNRAMSIVPLTVNGKFVAADLTTKYSRDTVTDDRIGPMTMMAYRLDDSRWLNIDVIPDSCKVRRSIIGPGGKSIPNAAVASLNQRVANDLSELPQLMFHPVIKPDGAWIAEVGGYAPAINVWNSETGKQFAIRYSGIGSSVISELAKKNLSLLQGGVAFDDFFAVQRNNEDGSSNIDFSVGAAHPLPLWSLSAKTSVVLPLIARMAACIVWMPIEI